MQDLERGRVILVTGATGAIGFEIAAQAAEGGAVVAVHGASTASVEAAIGRLRARVAAGTFVAAPADFGAADAIEAMVTQVAATAGRIDAVVHCASVGAAGITGPFAGTTPASYAAHAGAVLGTFQRLAHAALPHLAVRGGTLIAFASDAGRFAAPRQAVVGAAFAGLVGFVRNLATEVGRQSVRVHCLSPTFVADTPVFAMHAARAAAAAERSPLGLPTPADIAPIALFLCGPGARRITGQVISINGGLNA